MTHISVSINENILWQFKVKKIRSNQNSTGYLMLLPVVSLYYGFIWHQWLILAFTESLKKILYNFSIFGHVLFSSDQHSYSYNENPQVARQTNLRTVFELSENNQNHKASCWDQP